ncbi:MAG: cation:proton antiporter, partial [Proteobacteria bacterium]|nr:cation:proton antiporter [Pseudomonadota bacterium]
MREFRKLGRSILWISVFEASGAWILVTSVFFVLLKKPLYMSLLYGAISSATVPAATMMVIRQYNAKGYFTKILLGVVAIDDAWCLIIFAISFAISKSLYLHSSTNIMLVFVKSIVEIIGVLILGTLLDYIFSFFSRYFKRHSDLEIYTLSFILLAVGVADMLHLSLLLTTMALGIAVVNLQSTSSMFFDVLEDIESPLYLLFFVLAGANLRLSTLKH